MIEKLVTRLLSHQDPSAPHSLLTRIVVSLVILLSHIVWHGFYGLMGVVIVYLCGVELLGVGRRWMYLPIIFTLLSGSWVGIRAMADYWVNHGHG